MLRSPAKLNLALAVTGRRPDGFHTLDTVFERIDLADMISFKPWPDGVIRITCDNSAVPTDERNLVHKAARVLREVAGVEMGAAIHINKIIPVAAGLAGGSTNAATALLGLNELWALGLTRGQLIACAKKIGSDVAFFLYDTPFARGTGRGDVIKVLPVRHRFWHVLVTAKQPLLTKDVYGCYAAEFSRKGALTKKGADVTMLVRSLQKNDLPDVRARLFNDLEGPIGRLRPELLKLKKRLQQAVPAGGCFSGSGPSVFAVTADEAEAKKAAEIFRRTYKQVFVVRTA